ncbi:MAG: tRNA-modifying protein YgfZ, partial [Hyphomicrobiales bacterium]|nr:tRNA-modifying protein YgfZ [Hyphomicrobiales bacterium]
EDARKFLNGLITADAEAVTPQKPLFAALLTPQGKIMVDMIVAEAPAEDGGGFFLDCPRALALTLVQRFNFYKLRAKVIVEDLSEVLGVMAIWDGAGETEYGLCYADPRLPALGLRCMLPRHRAAEAAADLGATLVETDAYEAHRIGLGIPRGGHDFQYNDTFPHEADMDQLNGVDFDKGCYVGQEVVSRVEHRGTARKRVVPVAFEFAPEIGVAIMAGDVTVGTMGSSMRGGRGLAMLRLDRVGEAIAAGQPLVAGGLALKAVKPAWARFPWPGDAKTAE